MAPDWSTPTLRGAAVTLRPYRDDDFDATWEMVHEPEGNDLTATTASFTEPQIRDWIAKIAAAPDRLDLVVEEAATGEYAGEVVLNDYDAAANRAHFRIALRGPAWYGRGLGTEATRMVRDYAFGPLGIDAIVLEVLARNPRARRAYEKAGFAVSREYVEDGVAWVEMVASREAA